MKATVLSGSIDSKVQRRSEKSDQQPLGKGSHEANSSVCGLDATVLTEALPQPYEDTDRGDEEKNLEDDS